MNILPERNVGLGEAKFRNLISQAPIAMSVIMGLHFTIEIVNKKQLEIWQKEEADILHKPLFVVFPEVKSQGFEKLLTEVYSTGIPFTGKEIKTQLFRNGTLITAYFDFTYQPIRNEFGEVEGIMVVSTEVTEYVNARKQIESNALFNRTVLESSPDCLKVLDIQGRIRYMNFNGLCQMEIDDFSTVKNKTWWTLWGSENEAMVKASVEKALTGQTVDFTAFCPTAKGTPKWWNVVLSPMGKPGEPVQQIISVSRDVTEKIVAEEQIRKSEELFKLIFNNSLATILVTDDQGNYFSANKAASKLLGYTVDELLQMNVGDLKTTVQSGAAERFKEYLSKGEETGEFDFITKDGARKFGKYQARRLKADFNLSIMMDITEQKLSEEKIKENENQFRTFADSIQNLAWIANGDGWIYWYNKQWYNYTGTTPEEMEGWGWQKVHHPDHIEKVVAFVKEAWKKDEAFELTFPLRRHDGEYHWFLTRAYPIKDTNGTIERWVGTNTDVTEQKVFTEVLEEQVNKRTEELRAKNIQLELTNAELASFSFVASHDLKEPLRKIQTFSKLITDTENFSDKTQGYFNRIISAVGRMQNLIDSLLDLSHTNATELIFSPCDLTTIVDESISDIKLSILEKQAIIDYENLPTINGLNVQLFQLFTNLIGNSIKYSRPGIKPYIKITSSIVGGKEINHPSVNNTKDYHVITIADNGIGFKKEYAIKIFDLFQRLHKKNEYSGTGIGLAIVKKIVNNHNGFIVAEGKPNIGSTFTVYFPHS